MMPVSLLYFLVKDYMEGNLGARAGFYIGGVAAALVLIAITTYIQYNATFLSTYVESGVRRITLAEKLRKIPLSYFGKKDLSDLTSTIMADCARMETASSHFIPEARSLSQVLISSVGTSSSCMSLSMVLLCA